MTGAIIRAPGLRHEHISGHFEISDTLLQIVREALFTSVVFQGSVQLYRSLVETEFRYVIIF